VLTPTFNVATELLMALDLNDGFQYLPKLWSGVFPLAPGHWIRFQIPLDTE